MNMRFKFGVDLIHEIEVGNILDYQIYLPQIYRPNIIRSGVVSTIDIENKQISMLINDQTINIVGDSLWNRVVPAQILNIHLEKLGFRPCSSKLAYGSTVNEWVKLESNKTWNLEHVEPKTSWTLKLVHTSAQDGNSCLHKDGLWAVHHLQHYLAHPNDMDITIQQ